MDEKAQSIAVTARAKARSATIAAGKVDLRRVLDGNNTTPRATLSGTLGKSRNDLIDTDPSIIQEPMRRQLPRTILPKPSQNNATRRNNPIHHPIEPMIKPHIAKNTHLKSSHKISEDEGITKFKAGQKLV
jgi:hypothetical protein